MKRSDPPIIVRETYASSIENVWGSISDHARMTRWFFPNIPAFEARVGFKTSFEVAVENRTFTHVWRVTEVVPFRKLKYSWKYLEYQGDSFASFELSEKEGRTLLQLTINILVDFPDVIPEFRRESCVNGWEYFLNNRLKEYLGESKTDSG